MLAGRTTKDLLGRQRTSPPFINAALSLRKDAHPYKLTPTLSRGAASPYSQKPSSGAHRRNYSHRTDLRVVRMTELYDTRGWMMIHQSLGSNATNPMKCPSRLFTKPAIEDLWNCQRSFRPWGNTEVGIKVTVPDDKNGGNATVLAYAPFLEAPYRSWGPLVSPPTITKSSRF